MARNLTLKSIVNLPAGETVDADTLYEALGRSRQSIYYLRKNSGFPNVFGKKSGSPHYDVVAVANWLRSKSVKINWV